MFGRFYENASLIRSKPETLNREAVHAGARALSGIAVLPQQCPLKRTALISALFKDVARVLWGGCQGLEFGVQGFRVCSLLGVSGFSVVVRH